MDKDYYERLEWFKKRIGKRVYRDDVSCDCKICSNVEIKGLIIHDVNHAYYLNDCSFEMDINYRDNK